MSEPWETVHDDLLAKTEHADDRMPYIQPGRQWREGFEIACKRIAALEERLRDIANSGVSFSDARINYVEVQIDRGDWEQLQNDYPPSSGEADRAD